MRFVALLSFYDEPDQWLRNLPVSLKKIGVTHMVALDGAYARFPGGKAESPKSNHEALETGCKAAGIELLLAVPKEPWPGDEIQKRTDLFRLGETATTEDDWYIVIDGDTFVEKSPKRRNILSLLESTDKNVAEVRLMRGTELQCSDFRTIYRALRGLHCDGNHYTYRAGDGRLLWGAYSKRNEMEPAFHTGIVLQHMEGKRPKKRQDAAKDYYAARDRDLTEYGPCEYCGDQATLKVPDEWYWDEDKLKASWFESCAKCAITKGDKLKDTIVGLGAKPEAADLILEELWN